MGTAGAAALVGAVSDAEGMQVMAQRAADGTGAWAAQRGRSFARQIFLVDPFFIPVVDPTREM